LLVEVAAEAEVIRQISRPVKVLKILAAAVAVEAFLLVPPAMAVGLTIIRQTVVLVGRVQYLQAGVAGLAAEVAVFLTAAAVAVGMVLQGAQGAEGVCQALVALVVVLARLFLVTLILRI
jgi:hypothetical protein